MSQSKPQRRLNALQLVVTAIGVMGVMVWRWMQSYPLPLFDLYPLYYGAITWLQTGNAYALGDVVPASHHEFSVFKIGNGYPLPAVLLTLPLTLFSAHLAATLWVGLLMAGLLLAFHLNKAPLWLVLYVPLLEGLRIEQYTILVVIFQLLALWAYRERRFWLLAVLCALILTKPNHGVFFVAAILLMSRQWKQPLVVMTVIWGGSFLLDPNWVSEWLVAVRAYATAANQPVFWPILLLAIPLIVRRDFINGAIVLQLGVAPFPGSYAASGLCIGLASDRRNRWMVVMSYLWPVMAILWNTGWATALTLVLPVVVLSLTAGMKPVGRKKGLQVSNTASS